MAVIIIASGVARLFKIVLDISITIVLQWVMAFEYKGNTKRKKEAVSLWLEVVAEAKQGLTVPEIREKHTNPRTGKPYTREHIYWILKNYSDGKI